ncbi:MAG TPA: S8 family serine peptidase [Gaiellaceae bacterium]|nr:S8 family serine peptidase [Gaiellaceae bacterium]
MPDARGIVATNFVPRVLSQTPELYVLELTGRSAAEVQADQGRKLTRAEKDRIKAELKRDQDALRGRIEAAGGRIRAQFQSALNGIKVEIAPARLGGLASLPGVRRILPVATYERDNATSVPYIGAPQVWNASPLPNLRGEGVKIGIIDTGIDYTHANFGGPGTQAAYVAANATDTLPANPALFGPSAPRVKGGFDLVGDAYNASAPAGSPALVPHPDPNPLDCNGHGSHVAGTAAGSGVTAAGATYAGPYSSSIYTPGAFRIGPGVAPRADIYAYRVFGCAGSTNVTVDAIDMAFDDGMDVINMSLGSPFGEADDASAVASTNAAKAGMIVVASAGNNGANQYITGAPAAGSGAISVAANDSTATFPGFTLSFPGGPITALNANAATVANGTSYTIKRIVDNPATTTVDESLGCNVSDFGSLAPGTLAVVMRGVCARVAKAIFGQQAGAAAVAMINTDSGFPPFEGPIFSNPDTGIPFTVTIPFLGIRGVLGPSATADPDALVAADGQTVTLTNAAIANPNFSGLASFTSGGPRTGDSALKPDVTAPGVSIFSTGSGTGNLALGSSGTSMAAPHVAGVAALVRQAHSTWSSVEDLKAAIVNTASPSAIAGTNVYRVSRSGTGLVQPLAAVRTNVVAVGDPGAASVSFGFEELKADLSKTGQIKLRNHGSTPATFTIAATNTAGSPHTVSVQSQVTVPAGAQTAVNLTLRVPVGTVGSSTGSGLSFREVAGLITFTPASSADNNGVALRVPYYLVPRALSGVNVQMNKNVTTGSPTTNATLSNPSGPIAGTADFYAWGIDDADDKLGTNDVRAVGAQSFACAEVLGSTTCTALGANRFLVFAVNTWNRWSNAATNEFDISVDVDPQNANGIDYVVVGVDQGAVQTGSFNGRMAAFVFSTRSPGASALFFATAPTDSSTALLPILNSQLCRSGEPCLSTSSPRLRYSIDSFDLAEETVDSVPRVARWNAYASAISQGMFASVPRGASGSVPVTIAPAEWAQTPALGVMVVTLDNKAGKEEAALLPLELK